MGPLPLAMMPPTPLLMAAARQAVPQALGLSSWAGVVAQVQQQQVQQLCWRGLASAAGAAQPSTSSTSSQGAPEGQQQQQERPGQHQGHQQDGSEPSTSGRGADGDAAAHGFRASRYLQLHQQVLHREAMLKMGAVRKWQEVPRIHAVTLTINALTDTRLGSDLVEKKDLMLHALALEHISGEPASFVSDSRRNLLAAKGVQVRLTGSKGLDMLEKLVVLVLPNQMSFEGIPVARPVRPEPKKLARGQPPPEEVPTNHYVVDLRVDNILLFPDLEQKFELFEPVRSMQVSIEVDQAPSAEMASLYLAGFGFPLLGR